jgi:AMP nucleosidase
MKTKDAIVENWLPRYTDTPLAEFGEYILLTNFGNYVEKFAQRFDVPVRGLDRPMQTATENELSIINFGIGSASAATVMDLLLAIKPKGVLFLGKCGGVKRSTEIGHFILPIATIRGEGTSDDYLPTNRRVWEHDERFKERLKSLRVIGIDMETATIFAVGVANQIPRGALLLVSDTPMTPEGVKTERSDKAVTDRYVDLHLDIGIRAMAEIGVKGEQIKHFTY